MASALSLWRRRKGGPGGLGPKVAGPNNGLMNDPDVHGSDDTLVLLDMLANPFGWSPADGARRLGWTGIGQGARLRAVRAAERLQAAGLVAHEPRRPNSWRPIAVPVRDAADLQA